MSKGKMKEIQKSQRGQITYNKKAESYRIL